MAWIIGNTDYLEVTYFCQAAEQVAVNVVHYQAGGVTGTWMAEDLADDLSVFVAPLYLVWLSDEAQYKGLKIRLVGESGVLPAPVYSVGGTGTGGSGAQLPRQCAGMIQKRREAQGPKARGRFYAPFPGVDMHTNGKLSTAGQTALGAIRAGILPFSAPVAMTPGASGNVNLTLVMRNAATDSFSLVIRTQISDEFATMRSRGFYGRPNSLPAEIG